MTYIFVAVQFHFCCSSVDPCPKGYFLDIDLACLRCPPNTFTFLENSKKCELCLFGMKSNKKSDSCELCGPGMYGDKDGEGCKHCEVGSVSGRPRAIRCDPCHIGKEANSARTFCDDCPMGKYGPGNGDGCFDCVGGTFASIRGAILCEECSGPCNPVTGTAEVSVLTNGDLI